MTDIYCGIIGILISLMITFNNELSRSAGVYSSSVVIHIVGVAASLLFILVSRKKRVSFRNISLYMYTGGVIGVGNVVLNNISIPALGVSLAVSLALLGQILTSMFFDITGFMGASKDAPGFRKLIGVGVMLIGIAIMFFF